MVTKITLLLCLALAYTVSGNHGTCSPNNGTWWRGCNSCWCHFGVPACTHLWCGLPDCLMAGAHPCTADELCVPVSPSLCLRPECAPLGECRLVAGRRVEPPALPAPAACYRVDAATAPNDCARVSLQLAREHFASGAHVERACFALRRALATAIAGNVPSAPLVLLCDLAENDDALDLTIWVGEDKSLEGAPNTDALSDAVRSLNELVAQKRFAHDPLLGAATRMRVLHGPTAPAPAVSGAPSLTCLTLALPVMLAAASLLMLVV
ncbi:protein serrate-like [Leguminivora glycinivorella]|uniref:protein serrate-like n=1 Tax=Leguminivora glycinivorella TaxID=1035111 RepID=UPI00200C92DB|nr:protein serrate-like [Leguminivora glycinivorella]